MIICDRCRTSKGDIREVRMGLWREEWRGLLSELLPGNSKKVIGTYGEMSLCKTCEQELCAKVIATLKSDQVQPAYSLPPRRSSMVWFWWVLVVACGFINLVCYVLNLYERNHH